MSLTSLKKSDIEKSIKSALKKIGGSAGVTLEDLEKHLHSMLDDVIDTEIIEDWLNDAVDKEIVSLSDGKYKLRGTTKITFCGWEWIGMCCRGCSQQAGQATVSKVTNSKDKMKDSAEEAAEGKEKNEETAKSPSSTKKN